MRDKLKIGYFADGPWSHAAFELLINDSSIEICFIVPRVDSNDTVLKDYSVKYNIDYLKPVKINSQEFYDKAKNYECDLFVSMSFNQIFRSRIINLPRLKTINCHAGKLPFYRGRNILNWALINDEREFGITVHYIDEGIDTGDIILQRTFPITDEDDYGTLLQVSYQECALILYDGIKLIQKGGVKPIFQDSIHKIGSYFGQRKEGDEVIDWNSTSRELFNFLRAICKPGPMGHTTLNGELLKINRAQMIDGAPTYKSINGQILGKTDNGYLVKTGDSMLGISEIEFDGKLKVGDRLGT